MYWVRPGQYIQALIINILGLIKTTTTDYNLAYGERNTVRNKRWGQVENPKNCCHMQGSIKAENHAISSSSTIGQTNDTLSPNVERSLGV